MIPDFTTVIAVDEWHVDHLNLTLPTWSKNKPSLTKNPMIVIYDHAMPADLILWVGDKIEECGFTECVYLGWPGLGVEHKASSAGRFGEAQRYKMLSSFVHSTAASVGTPYWLKIDLDTVATGQDDWINPDWFTNNPDIIAPPWGYTKPHDQMIRLDDWVEKCRSGLGVFGLTQPLNLFPASGSDLVRHKRIISWCGFFNTEFTKFCSRIAQQTCGLGQLPVPSQDGFMWYVAKRSGGGICREQMKNRGWEHLSTLKGIREAAERAMAVNA